MFGINLVNHFPWAMLESLLVFPSVCDQKETTGNTPTDRAHPLGRFFHLIVL